MSSLIKLLPKNVANQIAAGEVVQRPSSVVKELLENSVDSGAQTIKLIIKDAGKTLIQVIDDGSGMSKEDINLCFLRHATSKIRNSKDLFDLNTMGFRGEALSSISSVSHLTINSNKDSKKDIGNEIKVNGGELVSKSEVLCKKGTSVSVQNLFYNIPARRNFLKSDNVELRHIIDEFHRVSLINHQISFIFINNSNEIFNLKKSIFKERIIRVFGKSTKEKLVPIKESTEIAEINGFIVKPEYSRKTKTSQFFFVNNRFIKNSHLHHAVRSAYEGLIFENHHPSYFLIFNVPNDSIDVNIHPNKTEIKFDNDQSIYAILRSSIKHSLGQFNISPSIDFENNVNLNTPYRYKDKGGNPPSVDFNKSFNPFDVFTGSAKDIEVNLESSFEKESSFENVLGDLNSSISFSAFQLNNTYIITKNSSGIVFINQKRAHQRILYEKFLKELSQDNNLSQTLIFPLKLDLNSEEIRLLKSLKKSLIHLGFNFNKFNKNEIEVSAIHPVFLEDQIDEIFRELIDNEISDYKKNSDSLNDYMAKVLSKCSSIKSRIKLENKEQESLVHDLFACKDPNISPFKKMIFKVIPIESINKMFFK
ncbi:MAG: DNA mismatch repair endonuclease MutL [Flavobacteriaceae bacterium]|nr:DNA mismatch repair endonuclease MutL [Flavobacteriaceae bacterium]